MNQQVLDLENSTAADERAARMDDYMGQLRANKSNITSGLAGGIGSAAFRNDSAAAATDVLAGAEDMAGLMSRMDAPAMQRQGEAFSMGHLGSDLGLLGRQSSGQEFLDGLRMNSIRRNPWIDVAAQVGSAYAGARMGAAGASKAGGGTSLTPISQGGSASYNSLPTTAGTWGHV